jgi:hypothetical protein
MGAVYAHSRQAGADHPPVAAIPGISAKRHLLRQRVYDQQGRYIGKTVDLLISHQRISHVVIGTRGPLGLQGHTVSVPIEFASWREGSLHLLHDVAEAASHFEYGQLDASGQ